MGGCRRATEEITALGVKHTHTHSSESNRKIFYFCFSSFNVAYFMLVMGNWVGVFKELIHSHALYKESEEKQNL